MPESDQTINPIIVKYLFLISILLCIACKPEQVAIKPVIQDITESVYASGIIRSRNQYQAFASINGIVEEVFVKEGDLVKIGSPIISISNTAQKLSVADAQLSANFNAIEPNLGKLTEARAYIELCEKQMVNDSVLFEKQKRLWSEKIGSKLNLDQMELAYRKSKLNHVSAVVKYNELNLKIIYLSKQAENNLNISQEFSKNYLVKSEIEGKVYQISLRKGESVSQQTPIALIGQDAQFLLEMQIDEYDIVSIQLGMPVLVVLNSYKDSVFHAIVTKILPVINSQSKTTTIEAEFTHPPSLLYPNSSFEANVVIISKKDAVLVPRNYVQHDSVLEKTGRKKAVRTGLENYEMIEILSNIDTSIFLIPPIQ